MGEAECRPEGERLDRGSGEKDWDPSVQALVAFPGVIARLTENVQWTTDLGNAFLAQQQDVMDAVQRMRLEAKNAGRLQTTKEQEVTPRWSRRRTVVEIVPANPEVIYVPTYSPRVIWGPGLLPIPGALLPPLVLPPPASGSTSASGISPGLVLPRLERLVLHRLARVR